MLVVLVVLVVVIGVLGGEGGGIKKGRGKGEEEWTTQKKSLLGMQANSHKKKYFLFEKKDNNQNNIHIKLFFKSINESNLEKRPVDVC